MNKIILLMLSAAFTLSGFSQGMKENKIEKRVYSLQEFSDGDFEKNGISQMAFATEGVEISLSKGLYNLGKHIVRVYGSAFIKIKNWIHEIEEVSYKETPTGFVQIFKNKNYKLTITTNQVKELDNGSAGASIYRGELCLIELKSLACLHKSSFYGEYP